MDAVGGVMDHHEQHEVVEALASAVDAKDGAVFGHSHRVADLALLMGRAVGLPEERLYQLYVAAHLHDLGKIGIPDVVLHKRGKLTEAEWRQIRAHPEIGARIVGNMRCFANTARVIRHHHEKYDGSGYPDGLHGEQIPLDSRIIAIADAFDAMTTARPYREALSAEAALQEVERCAETHFDPALAAVFLQVVALERQIMKEVG